MVNSGTIEQEAWVSVGLRAGGMVESGTIEREAWLSLGR